MKVSTARGIINSEVTKMGELEGIIFGKKFRARKEEVEASRSRGAHI